MESEIKKERSFLSKIKIFLRWFFGAVFLVLGLFSFKSSFLSGLGGVVAGLFLIPFFSQKITSKVKLLDIGWVKIVMVILGLILFFSNVGEENYYISIKEGKEDPQIMLDFQKDLIDLINNYKEAQVRTLVITQIKFGGASLEEAQEYVKETGKKWEAVEKTASKMKKYIDYQEGGKSSWLDIFKLQPVLAQQNEAEKYKVEVDMGSKPGEFTGMGNEKSSEVELKDKDKDLIQTSWDMVEVRRATLPDKSILKAVMEQFGTSAQKSKELIEQYHGEMAKVWKDEAKYQQSRENLWRGISTASSIGLAIGGGVLFMGELAAVSAGTTVLSGLKLAAEATTLAFVKTDAILEVMETSIIVATGDEKNAAAVTQTRNSISKIKAIVDVKDLLKNPTLADGGNISTLYNVSGAILETGSETFLFDQEENKMKITTGEKFTPISADGIVEVYFPKNFEYEYLEWGKDLTKQSTEKEERKENKNNQYRGDAACWRGDEMDNELYQKILKAQPKHELAVAECEKELGVKVSGNLGHPRWLEVMQCACNKDPEAAVARTYCCSDATMEEIRQGLMDSMRAIQNSGK